MAIDMAKEQGFNLPFVYNCSGYEEIDALKLLDGYIDIYLPDFKYMSAELAARYSHAPDYPEVAKTALAEMVRQVGGDQTTFDWISCFAFTISNVTVCEPAYLPSIPRIVAVAFPTDTRCPETV